MRLNFLNDHFETSFLNDQQAKKCLVKKGSFYIWFTIYTQPLFQIQKNKGLVLIFAYYAAPTKSDLYDIELNNNIFKFFLNWFQHFPNYSMWLESLMVTMVSFLNKHFYCCTSTIGDNLKWIKKIENWDLNKVDNLFFINKWREYQIYIRFQVNS